MEQALKNIEILKEFCFSLEDNILLLKNRISDLERDKIFAEEEKKELNQRVETLESKLLSFETLENKLSTLEKDNEVLKKCNLDKINQLKIKEEELMRYKSTKPPARLFIDL